MGDGRTGGQEEGWRLKGRRWMDRQTCGQAERMLDGH